MNRRGLISRRQALVAGLAAAGGAAAWFRGPGILPPTYGHLLRMGDNLTYAAHRILFSRTSLAREYSVADLSSFPATGTYDPGLLDTPMAETYRRLRADAFADWRLVVDGRVARPRSFSLADLQALPARTQITRHTCEEGWSAIGQWTGVPLRTVLEAAGIEPTARFVKYSAYDGWVDSIDLIDALHPQTILAYGMNGRSLPIPHGGPLRLRVEKQIGYKSMKFLARLEVTDTWDDGGPDGNIQHGWAWYNGL
ncbi:MAG: molybdopterin-dependent oxidoreductase [Gemmatimonadales bacterium]